MIGYLIFLHCLFVVVAELGEWEMVIDAADIVISKPCSLID